MAVTSIELAEKERYLLQIDKLVHSHTLRKSESLCRLLRYLANQGIAHPGVPLKEYQIATEVFGRAEDFDPQSDSAIRVQAGRLRVKLLEYYRHEGAADAVIVEIPTGSYSLTFHSRDAIVQTAPTPSQPPAAGPVLVEKPASRPTTRGWFLAVAIILALGLAGALVAVVFLSSSLMKPRAGR